MEDVYYQLGAMSVTGSSDSDTLSAATKQQTNEVITVVDRAGTMHFANPAVNAALGYDLEHIAQQSIFDLVHPDDRSFLRTALADLGACTCLPLVLRFRHADGSWRRLEGIASNQQDVPAVSGILLCLHAPEGTKESDTDLRLRIDRLVAERDEARAAHRNQTILLSHLAHAIGQPLTGVAGSAAQLADTPLDRRQRELLSAVRRSTEVLIGISETALDLCRLEAGLGQLNAACIDLHGLVRESVATVAEAARAKGVDLPVSISKVVPKLIRADESRLRQVLVHLLSDAITWSSDGVVSLSLGSLAPATAGNAVQVDFRITAGHLSPLREIPRLGSDSSIFSREFARKLLQLMGGQLSFKDDDGGDTSWSFTLMLTPASAASESETGMPAAEAFRPDASTWPVRRSATSTATDKPELKGRILLVEDNPANQKVATLMLQRMGLTVEVATDGAEAVAAFKRSSYDVILMDCQMPEMDGLEATRQIREIEKEAKRTPIIALTANVLRGQKEQCLEVGMDDYVSKPINPDILTEALINWIMGPRQNSSQAPPESVGTSGLLTAEVQTFIGEMYSDMDSEDLLHFLEMVNTSVPKGLRDLLSDFAANDTKGASQAAHRLRNSAGAVGARELSEALQRMEQALADGELRIARTELPVVRQGAEELAGILTKLTNRSLVA